MKLFLLSLLLALVSSVFASPIEIETESADLDKRAGPSGRLQTPYDGFSTKTTSGVEIKYTRVNGQSGFYTQAIDVDIIDLSNGAVHRVATGLTSSGLGHTIDAWFRLPTPHAYPHHNGNSATFRSRITEYQVGPNGPIRFIAANPAFEVYKSALCTSKNAKSCNANPL